MPNKKLALTLCLVMSLVLLEAGCKGKKAQAKTTPATEEPKVQTPEPSPKPAPSTEVEEGFEQQEPETKPISESAAEINQQGVLKSVYFAFDKSDLTDTARTTLRADANWLKANPKWNVVIEGNTDDRGTIEYNLALGQRRANAVRQYLESLGIAMSRMRTVSFGEERPVDRAQNEAAWAKNRRADIKVEAP